MISKLSQAIKDDSASIRNAITPLQASTVAIKDATTAIKDTQTLQQHKAIMEWLSPTDFPAQQHDIISRRQEGTAQWFLDSAEFKRWLGGSNKTLFCPGIPGAGKTMMAAIALDHIYGMAERDDIGIACLFCSYKTQANQNVPSLLASLLKQLVQTRADIATPVMHIYKKHSKRRSKPSLDDLTQALSAVCLSYSTTYVVVDALDECPNTDGARGQLIDKMRDLHARRNVHLLFTSRSIPEITQKFHLDPILEVRASEEDVGRYIQGQIHRLPSCIQRDEDLQCVVRDKITEAVDGM